MKPHFAYLIEVLTILPQIALYIAGIVLALLNLSRRKAHSVLALVAFTVLIVSALAVPLIRHHIQQLVNSAGRDMVLVSSYYVKLTVGERVIGFLSWLAVLFLIFGWRKGKTGSN